MKLSEIIIRLKETLPLYTPLFSCNAEVNSFVAEGSKLKMIMPVHGLIVPSSITIFNAYIENPILEVRQNGNICEIICDKPHNLTAGYNDKVLLSSEGGDKLFNIYEVTGDNTFAVKGVPDNPKFLLEDRGLNKSYKVIQADDDSFMVDAEQDITNITKTFGIAFCARVGGAASYELISDIYTKQTARDYWAFVVPGDASALKDLSVASESIAEFNPGEAYLQTVSTPFSVYVFAPATDSITAREKRDEMADVRAALFKSLLGVRIDSGLKTEHSSQITFVGDSYVDFNGAVYIHVFNFDVLTEITQDDVCPGPYSTPFRHFTNIEKNAQDLTIKEDEGIL